QVHPASWLHVGTVFTAVIGKSAGLITLWAAAGTLAAPARSVYRRRAITAGGVLAASVVVLLAIQLVIVRPRVSAPLVVLLVVSSALVIPGCALAAVHSDGEQRVDSILWAYLIAELALIVTLSRVTTGAWINYAVSAVVFSAVLTARALARTLEH